MEKERILELVIVIAALDDAEARNASLSGLT